MSFIEPRGGLVIHMHKLHSVILAPAMCPVVSPACRAEMITYFFN